MMKLAFVFVLALVLAPVAGVARIGSTFEQLKKERLMFEFHIKSIGDGPVTHTRTYEITPLPPILNGRVMIKLKFDVSGKLEATEYWVEKSYQKDQPTYAKHFAKEWIKTMAPTADTTQLASLANELEFRVEEENYHVLGEVPSLPAQRSAAYLTFIGKKKAKHQIKLKQSNFTIEHTKAKGKQWVRLTLSKSS